MNFNDIFTVRPTNSEMTEFMITVGEQLASEEKFQSVEEAQERITNTDWNLVAVLAGQMAEIIYNNLKQKENERRYEENDR